MVPYNWSDCNKKKFVLLSTTCQPKGDHLNNWNSLGISDLDTFDFGIQAGWNRVGNSEGFRLLIQTDSFITQLTAITSSHGECGSTRIGFQDDLVLPDLLATKNMMVSTQWPSWDEDSDLNQKWSDAVFSQGKVFRTILLEASVESPLVANLFEGWTGSTSARSSITRKPTLVGPQISFPIIDDKGEVVLVDLVVAKIRRR